MSNDLIVKVQYTMKKLDRETPDEPPPKKSKVDRGQNKKRPKPIREAADARPCPSIVNVHLGSVPRPCPIKSCAFVHDPIEYLKKIPKDLCGDEKCYAFETRGECPWGIACRFGSSHLTADGQNIVDPQKALLTKDSTLNNLDFDTMVKLQRKKYDFGDVEKFVNERYDLVKKNNKNSGTLTDEDVIRSRAPEKKKIDWTDKLYLGPLTTLGNLPFRRICKEFGADVTCGEMVMCDSLIKGNKQEWALVKRHSSEDLYGVQICGTNPFIITKVCTLINDKVEVDFVDLNLGCPIDLVYKKGGGCGMLSRMNVLEASIRCASAVLNCPFTVKTRVGLNHDTRVAHRLVPKFFEWGASLVTVHGRSREQRYTKFSDWNYIEECAKASAPDPVFGNGDILSYDDYVACRKMAPDVNGAMICRGGLIKPWLFTEIKEKRLWDISSKERFDILKKYRNYGLEHWGSDSRGVETARRFLLEWCSFLYRYVPVGLLERPPQKINERPPHYYGRDDLETMMASPNCADWIKLSEMLLGPVPEGFKFLPKHKANSYT
jgi:tRNA-dihydrouridine synthase 3